MPTTTVQSNGWDSNWQQPSGWVVDEMENKYNDYKQSVGNWTPPTLKPVVGFTQDQFDAQQRIRDMQGAGQPALDQAYAVSAGMTSYQPNQIAENPLQAAQSEMPENLYTRYSNWIEEGLSKYDLPSLDSLIGAMGGVPAMPAGGGVGAVSAGNVTADPIKAAQIARGDIRDVSGGVSVDQLQSYLSKIDPSYYQGVLDPTLKELERQKNIELQRNGAAAASAGAFGGGRHGVVESETNRGWMDQVAQTTGDLNLKKLQTAIGMIDSDMGRNLQAQLANQGQDFGVASTNAGFGQRTSEFNSGQKLDASKTNAQLALQAASQNASLQSQAAMASYQAQVAAMQERARLASEWMGTRFKYGEQVSDLRSGLATNEASGILQNNQYNAGATNAMNLANETNRISIADKNEAARRAGIDINSAGATLGLNTGQKDNEWQAGQIGLLNASGAQQQALGQAGADAQYTSDWLQQMLPILKDQMGMDMLSQIPYGTTGAGTSSSTTKQSTPLWNDIFNMIMQGGSLAVAASDKRLKTNIRGIDKPMDKVRKLRGVDYNWKTGKAATGLLAQDVEKAMPQAITEPGGVKHYDMPAVIGLLTEAVKDLDKRVSTHPSRRKK